MKKTGQNEVGLMRMILTLLVLVTCISCVKPPLPLSPETALQHYLQNDDQSYAWELKDAYPLEGLEVYDLLLTSQQWREYTWKHTLTVIVPEELNHGGALLFITGGKIKDGEPIKRGGDDEFIAELAAVAKKNAAVVAIIWQIPNQPLYDDLTEDALISFTLHNFKNDGDYSWPLLFPMVKTAVRAMDAVQEFSKEKFQHTIDSFVLSGASKRGWTTWLTGANDPRVAAIGPMVIDVLNMPVNLDYQVKVWKEYSIQIEDYTRLGIPQEANTEGGSAINTMIDPYSYRDRLGMPKMIFIGTNDEYWPVDAIKHYIDEIPGLNFIHYVPNAGHGLSGGEQALTALSAFFGRTVSGTPYPVCNWDIRQEDRELVLTVETSPDQLQGAFLWSADSEDRDFRNEEWASQPVDGPLGKDIQFRVALPESGFRAFYMDLLYPDPNGGVYTKSTRMFVADSEKYLID